MSYSKDTVQSVWEKARVMAEQDPAVWRKDECGAWIKREHYQHESSEFGWIIANVSPGGSSETHNLRPFHRENSFDIGAAQAKCRVTADQTGIDPHEHLTSTPRNRRVGDVG